jgi:hypothetical protein
MQPKTASGDRWTLVRQNHQLHPALRTDERLATLPWHSHASRPNSSQVFCVSAFYRLTQVPVRNTVLSSLFSTLLPCRPRDEWTIQPEFSDASLLGEDGARQPTSIDMFCTSARAVVAIESKFDRDATDGFGGCSQVRANDKRPVRCLGYYGPGSDVGTRTNAWCRLENWEGRRAPRLYWLLGKGYFRSEVFQAQVAGQACPLRESSYQLMRNFLFVAAFAARHGQRHFGVLIACPKSRSARLEEQLRQFRDDVLLRTFRDRVCLVYYEDYIALLRRTRHPEAEELAEFLEQRIATEIEE